MPNYYVIEFTRTEKLRVFVVNDLGPDVEKLAYKTRTFRLFERKMLERNVKMALGYGDQGIPLRYQVYMEDDWVWLMADAVDGPAWRAVEIITADDLDALYTTIYWDSTRGRFKRRADRVNYKVLQSIAETPKGTSYDA